MLSKPSATLPRHGKSQDEVARDIAALAASDYAAIDRKGGQFSCWAQAPTAIEGSGSGEFGAQMAAAVAGKSLFYENVFPSLKQVKRAVLDMTAELAGISVPWHGTVTMGGTESNLLATLAARQAGRAAGWDPDGSNIVVSMTGHPSFAKAGHFFGLEVRHTELDNTMISPVHRFAEKIDDKTVMIVASAPDYCYGLYDDIAALAALAGERDIWLHVDGAIGGTITELLRQCGETVPSLDLATPGVRSVSVDLHKHLYAPMGIGILFCRTEQDAALHAFEDDTWPAGRMVSPVLNGGRSAAPLVGAYAVMSHLGRSGISDHVALMRRRRQELIAAVEASGAHVFGEPRATVVGFGWDNVPASRVAAALKAEGWTFNRLRDPDGLHAIVDAFTDDDLIVQFGRSLAKCVEVARSDERLPELPKVQYG